MKLTRYAEADLPTSHGPFRVFVFRDAEAPPDVPAEEHMAIVRGDLNGARAAARWYQDVFGPENFYVEVQDHLADGSDQAKLNPLLYQLARETGAPLLATNDLQQAARLSDVTCYMAGGEIIEAGDTPVLFSRPANARTEDFLAGRAS